MKRLRNIVGLIALCSMAAFFTGCGDDDDPAPSNGAAPGGLNGKTYTLQDASTGAIITFSLNSNTYSITKDGVTETGSFTPVRNGNMWIVDTTDSTGTIASHLELTFNSDGLGTYVYRRPSGTVQGQFNQSSFNSNPTTSTGTGTDTTGTPTTTATDTTTTAGPTTTATDTTTTATDTTTTVGPTTTATDTTTTVGPTTTATDTTTAGPTTTTGQVGTFPAPATIHSMRLHADQSVLGGGATYTITLEGTRFTISDGSDGTGTFTYTPNGNEAHLRLDYDGQFLGDYDDMTLFFNAGPGSDTPSTVTGPQYANPNNGTLVGTFTYN